MDTVLTLTCVLQICDFGLAKWKQELATQTTTGSRCGTVAYMAPEVFKDVNTPRTVKYDVYSFGILLWELLAGKRPFENGMRWMFLLVCCIDSDQLLKIVMYVM